jgi:hypothetical protein
VASTRRALTVPEHGILGLFVKPGSLSIRLHGPSLMLIIDADTRGSQATIPPKHAKSGHEDGAIAERLIPDWLLDCDELHSACANSDLPFLPTRVLDVQNPTYMIHPLVRVG